MSDKTIKVCPFCGSEEVGLWLTTAPNGDDEYIVECDNCGCIYGKHRRLTADEAVDGWNRREA